MAQRICMTQMLFQLMGKGIVVGYVHLVRCVDNTCDVCLSAARILRRGLWSS